LKNPFIIGDQVYLRGLEQGDLENIAHWMNDSEVTYYLFMGDRPANLEKLREQFEREIRNPNDILFAVMHKENDAHIGWTGLHSINWISRSAEFRIFIGEKKHWKKGIGTEVTKLLVRYAFDKLNLNKVWLGVNI